MTVAALYVQENGAYYGIPGVDPWPEARDARLYNGPHPVVAHPPCARWCQLASVNHARWGTPIGEDGGCFEAALRSVRTYGGVLEHPAYSLAWDRYGLPRPKSRGGWNGEKVGPIDYGFAFNADVGGDLKWHERRVALFIDMCRSVEAGEEWEATTDGGWPRIGWGRVLDVGMYDGWPYWRPMPSFLLAGTLGPEWHSFNALIEAKPAVRESSL